MCSALFRDLRCAGAWMDGVEYVGFSSTGRVVMRLVELSEGLAC